MRTQEHSVTCCWFAFYFSRKCIHLYDFCHWRVKQKTRKSIKCRSRASAGSLASSRAGLPGLSWEHRGVGSRGPCQIWEAIPAQKMCSASPVILCRNSPGKGEATEGPTVDKPALSSANMAENLCHLTSLSTSNPHPKLSRSPLLQQCILRWNPTAHHCLETNQ